MANEAAERECEKENRAAGRRGDNMEMKSY